MSKEQELIDLMTENFGALVEEPFDEEPSETIVIDD